MVLSAAVAAAPSLPSFAMAQSESGGNTNSSGNPTLARQSENEVLLERGDQGPPVALVQRALEVRGLLHEVSAYYDLKTEQAVSAFQRQEDLEVTGKVDAHTFLALVPQQSGVSQAGVLSASGGLSSTGNASTTSSPPTPGSSEGNGASVTGDASASIAGAVGLGSGAGTNGSSSSDGRQGGIQTSFASFRSAQGANGSDGSNGSGSGSPLGALASVANLASGGGSGGSNASNGGPAGASGGGSVSIPQLISGASGPIEKFNAMLAMANWIASKRYAYLWGGGHNASFSGPYDCSGAVSAVLHAAGLLSSPLVSGQFGRVGSAGRSMTSGSVNIYYNASHVFMGFVGSDGIERLWGTSHYCPGGGACWLPASYPRSGFSVTHLTFQASPTQTTPTTTTPTTSTQPTTMAALSTSSPATSGGGSTVQSSRTSPDSSGGGEVSSSPRSLSTTSVSGTTAANAAPSENASSVVSSHDSATGSEAEGGTQASIASQGSTTPSQNASAAATNHTPATGNEASAQASNTSQGDPGPSANASPVATSHNPATGSEAQGGAQASNTSQGDPGPSENVSPVAKRNAGGN